MIKKPKYEIAEINNMQLTVDVAALSGSGVIWFNATEIAKKHKKIAKDFLRLKSTQEYINEILREENSPFEKIDNLIQVKKGGKHQGTWMHKELAYEFAGWCSALFRRGMHKWMEHRLQKEHDWLRERLETKTGFLPLTDAINHAHEDIKHYHFTTECNLLNQIILGMTSKQYRETHNIDNVRDNLSSEQLTAFKHLQMVDAGLIEAGISYDSRKEKLKEIYKRSLCLLRYKEAA